ncbi:MAG: hypothetical protein FD170_3390 [Bacteroidetes bacterium]|nr:MAG: hypothetical protein FD170_3390 [Bacteroidota bacterium]
MGFRPRRPGDTPKVIHATKAYSVLPVKARPYFNFEVLLHLICI